MGRLKGYKHSEITKNNISKNNARFWLGKKRGSISEETKKKIGLANSISLKGHKVSEETKRKISDFNKGKHLSEETKQKISKFFKGKPNGLLGKHWKVSEQGKKNISNGLLGNKYCLGRTPWNKNKEFLQMIGNTHGFKKGQPAWNKGKPNLKIAGKNNVNWKGGISTENEKIRHSLEYKLWQDSVFARDRYSCQKCKKNMMSYKLTGHHILNFSNYIELRFAIDNGITFCRDCHKSFHKKYSVKNNTREQLENFLKQ